MHASGQIIALKKSLKLSNESRQEKAFRSRARQRSQYVNLSFLFIFTHYILLPQPVSSAHFGIQTIAFAANCSQQLWRPDINFQLLAQSGDHQIDGAIECFQGLSAGRA